MTEESQYSRAVVDSMEEIFGRGFLSPGGPQEVVRTFSGVGLTGKEVLDWGCGLGGATMTLVRELGAGRVLGIDVDAGNLAHATANVEQDGLSDRIAFQLVEPGPLPLPDEAFDLVFSQAAFCHIEDKAAVFAEIHRVLSPGGSLVANDWMAGPKHAASKAYRDWTEVLRQEGLIFFFATPGAHDAALEQAGFAAVEFQDNSRRATAAARDCLTHIETAGRDRLLSGLGGDGYERFVFRAHARIEALETGTLQFCRIEAR